MRLFSLNRIEEHQEQKECLIESDFDDEPENEIESSSEIEVIMNH